MGTKVQIFQVSCHSADNCRRHWGCCKMCRDTESEKQQPALEKELTRKVNSSVLDVSLQLKVARKEQHRSCTEVSHSKGTDTNASPT